MPTHKLRLFYTVFSGPTPTEEEDAFIGKMETLLNDDYAITRAYSTDNAFLLHFTKPDPEDTETKTEPVVESVIQIAIDDNPDTVKQWTDQGWVVNGYYSKQVQLIKHRTQTPTEEVTPHE